MCLKYLCIIFVCDLLTCCNTHGSIYVPIDFTPVVAQNTKSNDKLKKLINGPLKEHLYEGKNDQGFIDITIGKNIKVIPEWTFSKISTLRSVTFTPSTKKICDNAFFSCKNLVNVNLENVDSIGDNAFKVTALDSVKLANAVSIGEFAFANCKSMKSLVVSSKLKKIGDFAFYGDSLLASCTIPNGTIGSSAFMACTGLKTINLNGKKTEVKDIGESAFIGCKSLRTVSLPRHLKIIRTMTFMNCESLETIEIPATVQEIEQGAFYGCTKLKKVILKSKNTKYAAGEFSASVTIENINIKNK